MSPLLTIYLIIPFMCSYSSSCFASSRKELIKDELNEQRLAELGTSARFSVVDPSRVIQLSWRPRVFLYPGFLSDKECDHLIALAHGKNEDTAVNEDKSLTNRLLKSSILHREDDVAARIEERISAWTFLPKENSRALQVTHYGPEKVGQNYNYFGNKFTWELNEPLLATIVIYLSNATRGGEILFPESEFEKSRAGSKIWSDCGRSRNVLKPSKGNAILFFNLQPNASREKSSSHARCPVLEGQMWCATKYFHTRPLESSDENGSECSDEDDNCPVWAKLGECKSNPVYMIGSPDYYGTCRKSCNAC